MWMYANRADQRIGILHRPKFLRGCFERKFGLGDSLSLEVEREGEGTVRVNTFLVAKSWRGEYFAGLTVRLEAAAKEGWRFAGWTPSSIGNVPAVDVKMRARLRVTARFVR